MSFYFESTYKYFCKWLNDKGLCEHKKAKKLDDKRCLPYVTEGAINCVFREKKN